MAVSRLLASALIVAWIPAPQAGAPQPAAPGFKDLAALMASLPPATVQPLDPPSALLLSALPLTCIDDLQPRPSSTRAYFWQPTYRTVDSYDKTRAFYGCADWSTAVSATWTLVTLIKAYPDVGSNQLIRETLNAHIGRENLEGELAYFRGAGNAQRPYGYAWFLRLYAALATWKDSDGTRYAESATPLARFFADGMVNYLVDLERPNRTGGQANSALSLTLLLDYVDATRDTTIKRAVSDAARRLYQGDTTCTTASEASSPEMVSPCLEEAALMSRVMDAATFGAWFDKFLPPPESPQFTRLLSVPFDLVGGRGSAGRGAAGPAARTAPTTPVAPTERPPARTQPAAPASADAGVPPGPGRGTQTNPRANWIALAFTRADAYARLAGALPSGDARAAVFRRLAEIHAASGQRELVTAAAYDAPWVGALAVSSLTALVPARGAR